MKNRISTARSDTENQDPTHTKDSPLCYNALPKDNNKTEQITCKEIEETNNLLPTNLKEKGKAHKKQFRMCEFYAHGLYCHWKEKQGFCTRVHS